MFYLVVLVLALNIGCETLEVVRVAAYLRKKQALCFMLGIGESVNLAVTDVLTGWLIWD
jgi:threonine/homoserine/homoserine lactone efflux protein